MQRAEQFVMIVDRLTKYSSDAQDPDALMDWVSVFQNIFVKVWAEKKLSCKTVATHMNGLATLAQLKRKDFGDNMVCKDMLKDIRKLSAGAHPLMEALSSSRVGRKLLSCLEVGEKTFQELVRLLEQVKVNADTLKVFIEHPLMELTATREALKNLEEPLKQLSAHRMVDSELAGILPAPGDFEKAALTMFHDVFFASNDSEGDSKNRRSK